MMRRCLCVVACSNHQGARSFSQRRGDGGDSRLHRFIRENQPPSQRVGGPRDPSLPMAREGYANPSRSSATPLGASQGYSSSGGGGRDGPAATASSSTDWAGRLQRELYGETDPLYGMAHKDYYRDPATGYSPQYAPRNFASGGAIAYPHVASSIHYTEAAARRAWLDHDVARASAEARGVRATSRELSAEARGAYLAQGIPRDRFASHIPESHSLGVLDQLHHSTVTSGAQYRRQLTLDRYQRAAGASPSVAAASLPAPELRERAAAQQAALHDARQLERLRIEHGLRDKERFDFAVRQRTARLGFAGYDQDRFRAQQRGTTYTAQQLPPAVPAASVGEAQRALREGPAASWEARAQRAFARNTVAEEPRLGEALTAGVVAELRAERAVAEQEKTQARNRLFGIGRQGALVQDGGPDKRTLKKHTNDERLLDAMNFSMNAYRLTPTDEHENPYLRGDTASGVGHLLNNRFDIERREDRISKGEVDLTERSIVHYGVPIQQTLDEFVFRRRNARGERPIDYFKPFPSFRDHRLSWMYQDTEGFALMRQRPDFLEWELFVRYRAHHQQRRELALQHGLEPLANETAQERDARRLKLDKLCEQTPFDPSQIILKGDEMEVDVETLRNWFGVYLLPSPTVVESVIAGRGTVGLHLQHVNDELGTADTREHVMSSRYFNQLLLDEGYLYRISRGFMREVVGSAKEVELKYAQPPEVLRQFSMEELLMYQEYVRGENEKHRVKWEAMRQKRRYYTPMQQYAKIRAERNTVAVIDLQEEEKGTILTISVDHFSKQLGDVLGEPDAAASITEGKESTAKGSIVVDGASYSVLPWTQRRVVPLTVELESGELLETTDEEFETYPLEVDANSEYNHALDYGIADYHYNRGNYIETQDVLWEKATAEGVEGWSLATHVDGLKAGLPVRARRHLACSSATTASHPTLDNIRGDYQRGRIVEYLKQPFFNPEPRLVTVCFASDGVVEDVPLAELMIWQRRYYGPERTVADTSSRYTMSSVNRYVDVADPFDEKSRAGGGGDGSLGGHFLDKYLVEARVEARAARHRTTKQITELDAWGAFDTRRPENHRPLTISHRRDYVRLGYFPRFTPWEWIAVQEGDQPVLHATLRQDDVGAAGFAGLHRHWRHKARPHGYLRNYADEVRELAQFVDGVTPWARAKRVRTYWEVREHHPMPQFHRPELGLHRNTAALLPTHLWETDKKTGKVKALKDSVRDYQTQTPLPRWVEL